MDICANPRSRWASSNELASRGENVIISDHSMPMYSKMNEGDPRTAKTTPKTIEPRASIISKIQLTSSLSSLRIRIAKPHLKSNYGNRGICPLEHRVFKDFTTHDGLWFKLKSSSRWAEISKHGRVCPDIQKFLTVDITCIYWSYWTRWDISIWSYIAIESSTRTCALAFTINIIQSWFRNK